MSTAPSSSCPICRAGRRRKNETGNGVHHEDREGCGPRRRAGEGEAAGSSATLVTVTGAKTSDTRLAVRAVKRVAPCSYAARDTDFCRSPCPPVLAVRIWTPPVIKRVGRDGRSFASVAVVYPACPWRAFASWPTWIVAHRGPIVVPASSARAAISLMRCRSDRRAMSGSLAQHLAWRCSSGYAASGSAQGTSLCQTAQTSRPSLFATAIVALL